MSATESKSSGQTGGTRDNHVVRGIMFMIGATVMFAISNAISKWVVAIYPVGEVMFARSFFSLIVCSAFMLPVTGLAVFATRRVRDHLARGLSQAISQTFTVIAFSLMPLAGAIAINFSAPLFSGLVSVLWLKERAGAARWGTLLVGICRRPRRGPTGRRFVSTGSAVCAGECGHVWQRHRRGARHEQDRVGQHAVDVADGDARGIPRLPAGLRIPLADAARRRAFRIDGSGQRRGAVSCGPRRCTLRRPRRCRHSIIFYWCGR